MARKQKTVRKPKSGSDVPAQRTLGWIFLLALFLFELAYVAIRLSIDSQRFTVTLPTTIAVALILLVALIGAYIDSVRRFTLNWLVPIWRFAAISMAFGIVLLLGANPAELFASDFVHNHGVTPGTAFGAIMISHFAPLVAVILYAAEARSLAQSAYGAPPGNGPAWTFGRALYFAYTLVLFPAIVAIVALSGVVDLGDIYPESAKHLPNALFLWAIAGTTLYGAGCYVAWALDHSVLHAAAAANPRSAHRKVKVSSS